MPASFCGQLYSFNPPLHIKGTKHNVLEKIYMINS